MVDIADAINWSFKALVGVVDVDVVAVFVLEFLFLLSGCSRSRSSSGSLCNPIPRRGSVAVDSGTEDGKICTADDARRLVMEFRFGEEESACVLFELATAFDFAFSNPFLNGTSNSSIDLCPRLNRPPPPPPPPCPCP